MSKVIRFTADWCQPCKVFAPIFDSVSEVYTEVPFEVYDIETEEGGDLAREFGVLSIPAVFVVDGDNRKKVPVVNTIEGFSKLVGAII